MSQSGHAKIGTPLQSSLDTGSARVSLGRMDPSLPQVFGRYLLVQRLSRGGMGEIFLAKHGLAGFEKLAVIKKILPHHAADEQFISRFVDEAQVAIKLSHVNVAQVFEVGRVGDEYFLALEYIDGRDLRRTLAVLAHRKRRLPVDLALYIARELANGLAYAHRRTAADGTPLDLVHCDISPPNVLVSFEGETKLIDFGIAKSAMRGTATDPKIGFGKFGYMAPEQLIRGGVVDHRTDIYAAGVVLYELLTGARLYEAGPEPDYRALAKKVARGEHTLPSEIDPALAPYDELVACALSPVPDDRFQSAAELRDAIQQCLVAVNPTISTDQLGAYMRELFADEMAAQRELHARLASAHLADFRDQLHTQSVETVSFAVARSSMGTDVGSASERQNRAAARRRRLGSSPVPFGSPAADTQAPPTAPVETIPPTARRAARIGLSSLARRRVLGIAGGAAIGIATVLALRGGAPASAPIAPIAAQTTVTAPAVIPARTSIIVEPIPVERIAEPPPPPAPRSEPPAAAPRAKDAPIRNLTRAQLGQKFRQVRMEYDDYKAKNGARLEREWGELATFIQYMPESPDDDAGRRGAARRLDEFRARMRE